MGEETIPFEEFPAVFQDFVSDVQTRIDRLNSKLDQILKTPVESGEDGLPGAPGKPGKPGVKGKTGDPGTNKSKDKNGFIRNSHSFEASATGLTVAITATSFSLTGVSLNFHALSTFGTGLYQEFTGVKKGLFGGQADISAVGMDLEGVENDGGVGDIQMDAVDGENVVVGADDVEGMHLTGLDAPEIRQ